MSSNKKYHAFISYRHADNKEMGRQWATWLHQAIETYEVPKELIGTKNNRGEAIPARIYPIFRDEEELPAHADLGNSIVKALQATQLLVVLCSPRAVDSTYVADEIDYFKKLGNSDQIIAAMIDGEPNTSWDSSKQKLGFSAETECFPTPLQYEYDNTGQPTDIHAEPIAADFRISENGKPVQGWTSLAAYKEYLQENPTLSNEEIETRLDSYQKQQHLMLLKIIAGILGVALGELTQRDKEYQLELERQRIKKLRRWLAAVFMLAIVSIGVGILAYFKQVEAAKQRDRAEAMLEEVKENLDFINYEFMETIERYVPSAEKSLLVNRLDGLVTMLESNGAETYEEKREIMASLLVRADAIFDTSALDNSRALSMLIQANEMAEEFAKSRPNDFQAQTDWSVSLGKLGDYYIEYGELEDAKRYFEQSLAITKQQAESNPDDMDIQFDLSIDYRRLSGLYAAQNLAELQLEAIRKTIAIREFLTSKNFDNTDWANGLSEIYHKLGSFYKDNGELEKAEETLNKSLKILLRLVADIPENSAWKNNLSATYITLGDIKEIKGDIEGTDSLYQKALSEIDTLTEKDPSNYGWKRTQAGIHQRLGDLSKQQNLLDTSLSHYQFAYNSMTEMLTSDPENILWQSDLEKINDKLGILYRNTRKFEQSIKSFAAAMEHRKKINLIDPDNLSWQFTLVIYQKNIATAQAAQKEFIKAIDTYTKSIKTARAIIKKEDTFYRSKELSRLLLSIADSHYKNFDKQSAKPYFEESKSISLTLQLKDPNDKWVDYDLLKSTSALASIYKSSENPELAVENYKLALSTALARLLEQKGLADENQWQREVAYSQRLLGDFYNDQQRFELARPLFEEGVMVMLDATTGKPNNLNWQAELITLYWRLGGNRIRTQDPKSALIVYQYALETSRWLTEKAEKNVNWQRNLSISFFRVSQAYEALGDIDKASDNLQMSIEHLLWMKEAGLYKSSYDNDLDYLQNQQERLNRLAK